MKFTKEEVNLCKQVAEKWRRGIKKGDWINTEEGIELVGGPYFYLDGEEGELHKSVGGFLRGKYLGKYFPLWTISDCLEFLYQKEVPLEIETRYDPWAVKRGWKWHLWWGEPKDNVKPWGASINAKTLLEACLKAVLAVLEEEK